MVFPIIAVMWKVFAHGLVIGGLLVSGIAFGQKAHPGAVAEFTLNPFEAHLGFLPNKPRSLPLTLPRLQATHAEGTSAYVIDAPRTATGITLVFSMDSPAKVIVERYNAPGGKNRKRKTWSIKEGSTRSRILSFNGLGSEESTIRILVSAPESPEHSESYDVTVRRAATFGTDPTLTALELSDGALTPAFASDTKSYEASVVYRATGLDVTARRKEAGTVLQLGGTASDGSKLAVNGMTLSGLTVGRNTIGILATSEDGSTTESYTVEVLRLGPSNDTTLADLTVLEGEAGLFGFGLLVSTGGGILRPAFGPDTRSYGATVPSDVTAVKMAITGLTASALNASGMTAHGSPLAMRAMDWTMGRSRETALRKVVTFAGLELGENTILIQVTAEDGKTTGTYRVTVTRGS